MKWMLPLFLCGAVMAQAAKPPPVIYVTNYVFVTNTLQVTNYVFGAVTNYVYTTNVVNITNTVNNFTYTTTTNWITNVVVMPQILSNVTFWGGINVCNGPIMLFGTNPGSVQTFSGTNLTGHLP